MLRIPPPLMGVIPQKAGRFGAACDATQVWAMDELAPEQARLLKINESLCKK
ncbi:portal protein [Pseudomonas frederiksbergensis]|uniref:portal protein n=1 Tax=Pseudomonas frederiksbergensis TaxID=104087 RepID=UPI001F2F366B|nr:portal protein [Pseudomonas frederiksbergensis]